MANALYGLARAAFGNADIDWLSDTIKCVLVDSQEYTPNLATDDFLADVPSGGRVGTPQTLANKTNVLGVMDADDVTFPSVTGDVCEYILIYQDTGVEATSRLIALIDTATGLPVTPNGGNISIVWPSGADKIFKL